MWNVESFPNSGGQLGQICSSLTCFSLRRVDTRPRPRPPDTALPCSDHGCRKPEFLGVNTQGQWRKRWCFMFTVCDMCQTPLGLLFLSSLVTKRLNLFNVCMCIVPFFNLFLHVFICLHWVLFAAHGLGSCGPGT